MFVDILRILRTGPSESSPRADSLRTKPTALQELQEWMVTNSRSASVDPRVIFAG
jgi:hypothetical protein